ncbi:cell division protein ZapD [Thiocapsa imhoffii]|uniref:Cell division protein ZapD n=1 Tax=Thiocapsa imhoffii TaxID=382777 RepID=A0A9X1B777_9GAMM|nr:cell division protein ZapD [Thiocapsa imhoffii]
MSSFLTFEHPLNERVRTFLRIEHLFERLTHFAPQYDAWATRVAVESLLDLASVTARADIKTELLKELERYTTTIRRIADQPGIDPQALERVLSDLQGASNAIQQLSGPIGQVAREDDFLKGIAQRASIPGGTCSFDLPHYHYWLIQPPEMRQTRLEHWLEDLRPAERAVRVVLSLARTSAAPRQAVAESGFFQEALDAHIPVQMVRVGINGVGAIYPEISGHKGRFSIRFMQAEPGARPSQSPEDIPFKLTCCVF